MNFEIRPTGIGVFRDLRSADKLRPECHRTPQGRQGGTGGTATLWLRTCPALNGIPACLSTGRLVWAKLIRADAVGQATISTLGECEPWKKPTASSREQQLVPRSAPQQLAWLLVNELSTLREVLAKRLR